MISESLNRSRDFHLIRAIEMAALQLFVNTDLKSNN